LTIKFIHDYTADKYRKGKVMRVAELINELKKCKPDARLNIFIPYEVGEDDKRDIFVSDFKIVEQNKQEVEIYSNDDLKPYYKKHLGKNAKP